MNDWEVQVITDSGIYKTVRVEGYVTYNDAQNAALSMTGANRVAYAIPVSPAPQVESESVEIHHYHEQKSDDEDYYQQLDEAEIEMYDLMCQIAMEKGEELPTISEFYEWLDS
jgi:hypothetical protein